MLKCAFDLGTNSIGYTVLEVDENEVPSKILAQSSRIFSDSRESKGKAPLNQARRLYRQAKRQRERKKARLKEFSLLLDRVGMQGKPHLGDNPLGLRARGLSERLSLPELGRCLWHIASHRAPRTTREDGDKESGKIRTGISNLRHLLQEGGFRSVGEFLNNERSRGNPTRLRQVNEAYRHYPSRQMLEEETQLLLTTQAQYHPILTEDLRSKLFHVMFFQRPLQTVHPGYCLFEEGAFRAPKALPVAQEFRILQEVANLKIVEKGVARELTESERAVVLSRLNESEKVTFSSLMKSLRKASKSTPDESVEIDPGATFNLWTPERDHLQGNLTTVRLKKVLPDWDQLSLDRKTAIVTVLREKDELVVLQSLTSELGFDTTVAQALSEVSLPFGYFSLSEVAIHKIHPFLHAGLGYAEACAKAGYNHYDMVPEKLIDRLPFYHTLPGFKRYLGMDSKIGNPTVHVALNQLMKVFNELSDTFGPFHFAAVEVTRELKKPARKLLQESNQRRANQERRARFEKDFPHVPDNRGNFIRWKLWEELPENEKVCIYTGIPITKNNLFSSAFQVDHLIPQAESFDDSLGNLVLCHIGANQVKKKKTPYEAFGKTLPGGSWNSWEVIYDRAKRFARTQKDSTWPRKLERFGSDFTLSDFATRQLNDTAYISKLARLYLAHAVPRVTAVRGAATALVRRLLRLDRLLRDTPSDQADLFLVSSINSGGIYGQPHHVVGSFERVRSRAAFSPKYLQKMGAKLVRVTPAGKVEDPVGVVTTPKPSGPKIETVEGTLTTRKAIGDLTKNEISYIVDERLRKSVEAYVEAHPGLLKHVLSAYGAEHHIRRVKIAKQGSARILRHGDRKQHQKALKLDDNHHGDIVEVGGKWEIRLTAYAELLHPPSRPSEKILMRLHKNDMIRIPGAGQSYNKYPPDEGNGKKRSDHRHHAVDSFVIGLLTPSYLAKVQKAMRLHPDDPDQFPKPWAGYQRELKEFLKTMVVSHKTDHGVHSRQYEETSYGFRPA